MSLKSSPPSRTEVVLACTLSSALIGAGVGFFEETKTGKEFKKEAFGDEETELGKRVTRICVDTSIALGISLGMMWTFRDLLNRAKKD